ncbi:hypothetical protein EZ456_11360 [Pedobacter psychrodurus]|uniref:Uncharacterized protein n=1 Tax=Pedobacter psychrodurus TaxID=2530456 RepID=A0A4R0Q1K8_9SPHI|nr:hypothetical protein [Pedobacter psychrodurus]TCD27110.1 hypothetical protein EZ456_11360 [Pedobacter psychrodurus]
MQNPSIKIDCVYLHTLKNRPMTEIILKDNVEQNKIDALLAFLKSWDIDAELRTTSSKKSTKTTKFSLSKGIWSDYSVNSAELRDKAWNR